MSLGFFPLNPQLLQLPHNPILSLTAWKEQMGSSVMPASLVVLYNLLSLHPDREERGGSVETSFLQGLNHHLP